MFHLIKSLQKILDNHPLEKKIMFTSSYIDSNSFQKILSLQDVQVLNLQYSTFYDIAREYALTAVIKNKLKILDNSLGLVLVIQILKELSSQEKLSYFKLSLITSGLAKTIFRTIKEIRAAGYTSKNWLSVIDPDSGKMNDLFQVLTEYEKQLQERGLADEARIYNLAISSSEKKDAIFIIPTYLQLNPLEQLFLQKLRTEKLEVVEVSCPEALVAPGSFPLAETKKLKQSSGKKIFDYLNHQNDFPIQLPATEMEFFNTHGEYAEVKEVLRIIFEQKIPVGEIQILYTSQKPYTQYFYQLLNLIQEVSHLADKRIPATFHGGIHIKNSHPGKLFFDTIDWISENYSIQKLFLMLNSGNIELHLADPFHIKKFASLIRQSPIGWGRARYLPGLQLAITEKEKLMKNTSDDKRQLYQEEIAYYKLIKNWIERVFQLLPDNSFNTPIFLGDIAGGVYRFISEFAFIADNKIDEEVFSVIKQKLSILEKNAIEKLPLSEALLLLTDVLENEYICYSEPCPGKLHIASYKKGRWVNRPVTFFVGMDSHKFPGRTDEGTVFLDSEKRPYKHLLSDSQKNRIEQLRMIELILSLPGKKYLSYSSTDTLNNQEQAPAFLVLQLYRLANKDREKSVDDFYHDLGERRKLIPRNKTGFCDEGDILLFFSKQEKRDFQLLLQQKYSSLLQGVKASNERKKEEFNVYCGKVTTNAGKVDPRQNRGIVLSSSKLERIALCPYLYFLKDILKIKLPEEMEYQPVQWLSPLERGLLLHKIYEHFYCSLPADSTGITERPLYKKHWTLLKKIAVDNIEEKRKYLAPPGDLIFETEKREILESCVMFLTGEEKNYQGQIPQYFELAFGTRDNEHKTLGKIKSVEINLPARDKINFQGKIDRVDKLPDNTYRIIDYKTGSSKGYKKGKPFRYGQQIQHALYAIALEKILEKKNIYDRQGRPAVSEAGYYFPTAYGQGSLILYKQDKQNQALQIVELLLDIASNGYFAMTQKSDHFMCRDYQDIMEQNEAIPVSGKKAEAYKDDPALEGLRRLRQFE